VAVSILCETYKDDPNFHILRRKDKNPTELLKKVFDFFVSYLIKKAGGAWGLFYDNQLKGVALWFPPDYNVSFPLVASLKLAKHFSLKRIPSLLKLGQTFSKIAGRVFPESHWQLDWIAMDSRFNELKYVEKLVNPVIQWANQDNLPCGASVVFDRTEAVLRELGFYVLDRTPFVEGGVGAIMRKDASVDPCE
jgi:hypothetical protein